MYMTHVWDFLDIERNRAPPRLGLSNKKNLLMSHCEPKDDDDVRVPLMT